MFDYFKQAKRLEIKALKYLAESGRFPAPLAIKRPDFSLSLRRAATAKGPAVIAEYKRASPSLGDIALNIEPGQAAGAYSRAGAAAMSVLTEKSKFKGRMGFIQKAWAGGAGEAGLPLLRKDFIFDPLQARATAATPASALLLIVGLTPEVKRLRELRREAEKFGLQGVVEVTNEEELELARESGATIIQVNARDFRDLSVDLSRSLNLARRAAGAENELWIAASGFSRPEELLEAKEAGYTAVLIGTSLMRGGDLAASLARLSAGLTGEEERL